MSLGWLLFALVVFRVLNAISISTFFNPDEYWQSLEIAHRSVFGYGYITWEWRDQLRSFLHPAIFAAVYWLLKFFNLDSFYFMLFAPRVLQGALAGVGDWYLYKLSAKGFGSSVAKYALICQLFSWFTFYCTVRTYSNSLESILVTIALYYFPTHSGSETRHRFLALCIAALSVVIRPTSAVIWLFVGVWHFAHARDRVRLIFLEVIPAGVSILGLCCLLDRWYYNEWTVPAWRFLQWNVLKDLGSRYGTHPWHWYFTNGFPTILFTLLPMTLAGVYLSRSRMWAVLILWTVAAYSLMSHKEFRFVLPTLPLCMMYCGVAFCRVFDPETFFAASHKKSDTVKRSARSKQQSTALRTLSLLLVLLLLSNIPMAAYFSYVHQRGPHDLVKHIHADHAINNLLMLMPCHSTPFYSHIHRNITIRMLDCSPSDAPGYRDETERFYDNPRAFLQQEYSTRNASWPTHVVLFDSLLPEIESWLQASGYILQKEFFHTHLVTDSKQGTHILLYNTLVAQ